MVWFDVKNRTHVCTYTLIHNTKVLRIDKQINRFACSPLHITAIPFSETTIATYQNTFFFFQLNSTDWISVSHFQWSHHLFLNQVWVGNQTRKHLEPPYTVMCQYSQNLSDSLAIFTTIPTTWKMHCSYSKQWLYPDFKFKKKLKPSF